MYLIVKFVRKLLNGHCTRDVNVDIMDNLGQK